MPVFNVRRQTVIDASPEKVFATVADFGTWTKWSPWLSADNDANVNVTSNADSVGAIYSWEGDVVGQGEIEHVRLDRPTQIDEEIRFLKPFKSKSQVGFEFKSVGDQAEITWSMDGSLPFFLFWMKPMMSAMIGMDYDRGLRMLKECIETGVVASKTEVVGVEALQPQTVVGLADSSPISEIGQAMTPLFDSIQASVDSSAIEPVGSMLSLYHPTSDMKKGRFDFTCGYPVSSNATVPAGMTRQDLPGGKAFCVRHTGSYENLGNAWNAAYQIARYKKLRIAKTSSVEIYRNSISDTPAEALITDIYLPLK